MTTRHSDDLKDLAAALVKAQAAMKPAVKDSTNPHFKSTYADLASVWDAAREPLTKNGLAIVQAPDILDGRDVLVTTLLHTSGQWMSSVYPLSPVKPDPQALGSAMTYGRRYTLMAMVGISPEDDDGNAAVAQQPSAAARPAAPTPRPQPAAVNRERETTSASSDADPGLTVTRVYGDKTPYAVLLSDGRKLTFFSESLLEEARDASTGGYTVRVQIEEREKGGKVYQNLKGLFPVATHEPEPAPAPDDFPDDQIPF